MGSCGRCGAATFYTRVYSGESLCAPCFSASIEEKTNRTIRKHTMIRRGERVAVAVSGGKDSLALLRVLHRLGEEQEWNLIAVTVDEGVAGYREEALEHARSLTSKLGVEHRVVSYANLFGFTLDKALAWKDEREVSSCSFCGVFRRRAIDAAAKDAEASVVATAHNLDDFVQTFMMNLLHGDVARLGWMGPSYSNPDFPVRRVKPFMEIYEQEIALYAHMSGVPFQSTSCPYMHEGLRSEVRDQLNVLEAGHPGIKNVLLRSGLDVISKYSSPAKATSKCEICGSPTSGKVCASCRMKKAVEQHINYAD